MSILSGLATTINSGLSSVFFDAVLTKEVVPASPSYDPADPPAPASVPYSCKALRDYYSRHDRADGSILEGDAKILILAASLSVQPEKNDIITITGQGAGFAVITFDIDPANACWVIQGRQ